MSSDNVRDVEFATLTCGTHSTAAVAQDGRLWMWGNGSQGVLGLSCEDEKRVPEKVEVGGTPGVRGNRIGRCRHLSPDCALAFAMSQHPRVGKEAKAHVLMPELVERILQDAHSWPAGPAGELPGLLRIMGGVCKVPASRRDHSEARSNRDIPTTEQQVLADENEAVTGGEESDVAEAALAANVDIGEHIEPLLLPGHNMPLAPLPSASDVPTSLAAQVAAAEGAPAHVSQQEAIPAGAVGASSDGPASGEGNSNGVPAPTHHVVLPVLRLAGGYFYTGKCTAAFNRAVARSVS